LQQSGELLVRAEELKARRAQAFDALNGENAGYDIRVPMQTLAGQLQQADWQTAPEELDTQARALIEERGKDLSSGARAIFTKSASQYLSSLHGAAVAQRTQQTQEAMIFTASKAVQAAQEQVTQATNHYDRTLAIGQLDETLNNLVRVGGIKGAAVADIRKKTLDSSADMLVQQAIQADPAAMKTQLYNQLHGRPVRDDLPLARADSLAQLHQEAFQVGQQRLGQQEHAERREDLKWAKLQERTAADIEAKLSIIEPLPGNVGQYDQILADVNAKATGENPELSYQMQNRFTSEIRTLRAAALRPRDMDDPATERKLITFIDAADNAQAHEAVRRMVVENAGMLKPETYKSMLATIYDRKKSGHYSQQAGYREGVRIIIGGDIGESNLVNMMRGGKKETQQIHERQALEEFSNAMSLLATESIGQVNAQGPEIAQDIRRRMVDLPMREEKIKNLPLPLLQKDAKTPLAPADAQAVIAQWPYYTDAQKQRLQQQYDDAMRAYEAGQTTGTTTTTPTTGRKKIEQR
jgi:hypothetical protein